VSKSEIRIRVKFPCGYEASIEVDQRVGFMDFGSLKSKVSPEEFINKLPECPLHGKECPDGKKF